MDLDALRAFVAVVDSGSFVAAATSMRWSRATLRRRVDELESVAGVALLTRTESGATPTHAGELLAKRGRVLLAESSALLSTVRDVASNPAGSLRIVLPVGLPPKLLTLLLATVRSADPGLHLQVLVAEDPVAMLLDRVDVALSLGDLPPEGPWVSHDFARVPERLLASPSYLRVHGTPKRLEDLESHALFAWRAPGQREHALPLRDGGRWPVRPKVSSADIHTLRECAAADLGIAFALDPSLPGALSAGAELVPVLDDLVGGERTMRVVVPSGLPESRRIVLALEQLRSIMSSPAR